MYYVDNGSMYWFQTTFWGSQSTEEPNLQWFVRGSHGVEDFQAPGTVEFHRVARRAWIWGKRQLLQATQCLLHWGEQDSGVWSGFGGTRWVNSVSCISIQAWDDSINKSWFHKSTNVVDMLYILIVGEFLCVLGRELAVLIAEQLANPESGILSGNHFLLFLVHFM